MTYRALRRLVVFVVGISVLAVGIVMLVTPGPAVVVIPLGLGILATEFLWARALLARVRREIMRRTRGSGQPPGSD